MIISERECMSKFMDQGGVTALTKALMKNIKTINGQTIFGTGNISIGSSNIPVINISEYGALYNYLEQHDLVPGQTYMLIGYLNQEYMQNEYPMGDEETNMSQARVGWNFLLVEAAESQRFSSKGLMCVAVAGGGDSQGFHYNVGDILEVTLHFEYGEEGDVYVTEMYDPVRDIRAPYDFACIARMGNSFNFPIEYTRHLHIAPLAAAHPGHLTSKIQYNPTTIEGGLIENVEIGSVNASITAASIIRNLSIGYSDPTVSEMATEDDDIEDSAATGRDEVGYTAQITIKSEGHILDTRIGNGCRGINLHSAKIDKLIIGDRCRNIIGLFDDELEIYNSSNLKICYRRSSNASASYNTSKRPTKTKFNNCTNVEWYALETVTDGISYPSNAPSGVTFENCNNFTFGVKRHGTGATISVGGISNITFRNCGNGVSSGVKFLIAPGLSSGLSSQYNIANTVFENIYLSGRCDWKTMSISTASANKGLILKARQYTDATPARSQSGTLNMLDAYVVNSKVIQEQYWGDADNEEVGIDYDVTYLGYELPTINSNRAIGDNTVDYVRVNQETPILFIPMIQI